jgi:hypothetical protein
MVMVMFFRARTARARAATWSVTRWAAAAQSAGRSFPH